MSDDNYATNLLRVILGFLHVSLAQQNAVVQFGKPFHTLTADEKASLQDKMLSDVMTLARQVDEETLKKLLASPAAPPTMKVQ